MFRKLFPYGMQEQQDGTWVFFNRDYKPVGMNVGYLPWVEYKDHPVDFRLKGLDPATVAKLSVDGIDSPQPIGMDGENMIFFYDEKNDPLTSEEKMNAYLEKLKILMHLQTRGATSKKQD